VSTLTPLSRAAPLADHLGGREGGQRARVPGQIGGAETGGPAGLPGGGLLTERGDDPEQGGALQERQPPGAEVIEQGTEPLGPDGDLRMQLPCLVEVE